jgi:hypothetical protein
MGPSDDIYRRITIYVRGSFRVINIQRIAVVILILLRVRKDGRDHSWHIIARANNMI